MSKRKDCKSDVFAAIHETATDLHDAGAISVEAMREFDVMCLTPPIDEAAGQALTDSADLVRDQR